MQVCAGLQTASSLRAWMTAAPSSCGAWHLSSSHSSRGSKVGNMGLWRACYWSGLGVVVSWRDCCAMSLSCHRHGAAGPAVCVCVLSCLGPTLSLAVHIAASGCCCCCCRRSCFPTAVGGSDTQPRGYLRCVTPPCLQHKPQAHTTSTAPFPHAPTQLSHAGP
jgi:hypothetical protein